MTKVPSPPPPTYNLVGSTMMWRSRAWEKEGVVIGQLQLQLSLLAARDVFRHSQRGGGERKFLVPGFSFGVFTFLGG